MTLSKRGLRKIVVDGEFYVWKISPESEYINLIVSHQTIKGSKIEVQIKTDINRFWVEFPNVEELDLKIITPSNVSRIIKQAKELGWNPCEKGPTIPFYFEQNTLIKGK